MDIRNIPLTPIHLLTIKLACGDMVFVNLWSILYWITDQNGRPYELFPNGQKYGRYAVPLVNAEETTKLVKKIPLATKDLRLEMIYENPAVMCWKVTNLKPPQE